MDTAGTSVDRTEPFLTIEDTIQVFSKVKQTGCYVKQNPSVWSAERRRVRLRRSTRPDRPSGTDKRRLGSAYSRVPLDAHLHTDTRIYGHPDQHARTRPEMIRRTRFAHSLRPESSRREKHTDTSTHYVRKKHRPGAKRGCWTPPPGVCYHPLPSSSTSPRRNTTGDTAL